MPGRLGGLPAAFTALAVFVAVCVLTYAQTPDASWAHVGSWWALIASAGTATLWRAVSGGHRRSGWVLLSLGVWVYLSGDVVWDLNTLTAQSNVGTVADVCYQVAALLLAGGLVVLTGTDRDDLVDDVADSALIGASFAVIAVACVWLPLNKLGLTDGEVRSAELMLVGLIVAFTAVARALSSPAARRFQSLFVVASAVGLLMVADLTFFKQGIAAGWSHTQAYDDAGWDYMYFLAWALLAAGALMPSAAHLEPTHEWAGPGKVGRRSVAAIGVALLSLAWVALVQDNHWGIAALIVLIGVRLAMSLRSAARRHARQGRLRHVAGELGAAGGVFDAQVDGWLGVLTGAPGSAHLADGGGCRDGVAVLPLTERPGRSICVHRWGSRENRADVTGFADMLALAYEREGMRDSLADVQFKSQLSAWLEHTSDVLLAVRGGTVVYASPAARSVFASTSGAGGWPVGARPADLGLADGADEVALSSGVTVSVSVSDLPGEGVSVWTLHDITAQKDLTERLHTLAYTDTLTEVGNRYAFVEALTEARAAWLGLVDVDDFKGVNDTFGHPSGDQVLRAVARRLAKHAAVAQTFRIGGDEFAVLLHDTPEAFATLTAASGPVAGIPVSLTIGVAPLDGDAMKHADAALYEAKRGGKGRVHLWGQDL